MSSAGPIRSFASTRCLRIGLPRSKRPSASIRRTPPSRVRLGLEASIAGAGPYDLVLPLITANGRQIWVHARGDVERAKDGTPVRICGVIRDVTARHEAESALRASEERLKLALDGARDGVWDWDLETNEVYFSPRWKEILGYSEDEISHDLGEWSSRVPDEEREIALQRVDRCIAA